MLDVIQIVGCVAGNNLPFAGCAFIIGVVRQLKVGLAVRLGQPHHDLVFAVDEAEGAVSVVNNSPNQNRIRINDLIACRSDGLGHQIPIVVCLVSDRHTVTRVVDDDLIAALDGRCKNILVLDLALLGNDSDSAFTGDLCVVRAEDAVGSFDLMLAVLFREGLDIIRQNHVVLHDIVQDIDRAVEHRKAVAEIAEGVVIARHVVGLGQVERFAADHDVLDAVFTRRARSPNALVVLLDGAGDVGMDLVAHAGDLEEAAAFCGADVTSAPFERVEDLLAGDLNQASDVAEGVDALAGLVGDVAGDSLVANTAAVHDGEVDIQIHVVKQIVQRVCREVAGVGFLLTDETVAVLVVVIEGQRGVADDLAELGVDLGDPSILDLCDVLIGAVIFGDQLCLDAVSSDAHSADRLEVAAGLAQNDALAVLILDFLHLNRAVGVTVDERVNAGSVGNDLFAGPRPAGRIVAAVAEGNDIVSARPLGNVNRNLHGSVQRSAVLTAGDAVDVVACLVLEVLRGGLGEGFRRGDTDNGDLLAADLEELVSIENAVARDAVLLMIEVCGQVRIISHVDQLERTVHAVVELVVAEGRGIVAGGVHQLNDGLALVHRAVSSALHMVARVEQEDAGSNGSGLRLQVGDVVIGQLAVDVGVDVVGVVDDDLILVCELVAAAGADAVFIVVAGGRDDLGLGLTAARAGVEHFAVFGAGSSLGYLALIPSVLGAGLGSLVEHGDDLCKLSAGRVILRQELAVGAADDLHGNRPVKGFLRISSDLVGIREALEVIFLDLRAAGIAPNHGDELLARYHSVRIEAVAADAVHDAVLLRPCYAVLVPVFLQVDEGRRLDRRNYGISQAVENNGSHCTGAIALRLEAVCRGAVHKLRIVLVYILDIRREPVGIVHVRKVQNVRTEHGGDDADDHSENQKHR